MAELDALDQQEATEELRELSRRRLRRFAIGASILALFVFGRSVIALAQGTFAARHVVGVAGTTIATLLLYWLSQRHPPDSAT